MTPLCELAVKYDTDKYSRHRYTGVYHELLADRARAVRRVLEIGIKRGASLRMWEEFFPNAGIVGIDIKKRNLFDRGRITSYLGDQEDARMLNRVARERGPFDLIVDDGKHRARSQIAAARALLPHLARDGVYVIEDVRHGPEDDPDEIARAIPSEFEHRLVLTTDLLDSGLMIVRRTQRQC